MFNWLKNAIREEEIKRIENEVLTEHQIEVYVNTYIKDNMNDALKSFNLDFLCDAGKVIDAIPFGSTHKIKIGVDWVEVTRDLEGKFHIKTTENNSAMFQR